MATFATIAAITGTGTVFAVNAQGVQRVLKAGDTLEKGETLRTTGDARVELMAEDGSLLSVNPNQVVRLDENVFKTEQTPTAAEAAVTTPATTDTVLQALENGQDLSTTLDATAAGLGGGGEGGGSTFVQLGRISEGVNGNSYNYNFNGLGTPPVNEGIGAAAAAATPTTTPTTTPAPTQTPAPTETPAPTQTPAPTETPAPTQTPAPTETPAPTQTPAPTETPAPTQTPAPTDTPAPTQTPAPTETPAPTQTPAPTETPAPTQTPAPTETPAPTQTPAPNNQPPEASDDSAPRNVLGQPVTVSVTGNDRDADGSIDRSSVRIVGAEGARVTSLVVAGQGTWTVNTATGDITFAPNEGFVGNPSPIRYTVADNRGALSNAATVTVSYGPSLVDDARELVEGSASVSGTVAGNDQVAGGTYVAGTFTGSFGGRLVLDSTGAYTYTAPSKVNNPEQANVQERFTYTVTGVDGNRVSAQLVVDIKDTGPVVSASNAVGSTDEPHKVSGTWSEQLGADATVLSATVTGVMVGGNAVSMVGTPTFNPDTNTLDVTFSNPAGGDLRAQVVFNSDGTYLVDMAAPQKITISATEFQGAVQASGPTDTYTLSYTDSATGLTETATVRAVAEGTALTLKDGSNLPYAATAVGTQVNASSDGIGLDNNVLSSYVGKGDVLTAESLSYDPNHAADQVTVFFKDTGSVGFGQGGAEDVLNVTLFGVNGETSHIVIDSRDTGPLASYVLDTPDGWTGGIGSVSVTAGFYTTSNGAIHGSDIKLAFGFTVEDRVVSDSPVKLNMSLTLSDQDGSTHTASFSAESQVGHAFDGTASSDVLTGSTLLGSDTFHWALSDAGHDVVKDFNANPVSAGGDVLDLKDLLVGEQASVAGNLDSYLHFAPSGSNTVISVHSGGLSSPVTQTITLENVVMSTLGSSDSEIIAKLLANGNLKTD